MRQASIQKVESECGAASAPLRCAGLPLSRFQYRQDIPRRSLNHAIVGPFPREIPRASVFKLGSLYTSNRTLR
jgi:hypothetical protein